MGFVSKYVGKIVEQKLSNRHTPGQSPIVLFEANQKTIYKRLLENKAWYTSDERALRFFYKQIAPRFNTHTSYQNDDLNYFWENAPEDVRKINAGFATLISNTMGNVLFASGISENGFDTDEIEETLNEIIKDNKMLQLFQGGAVNESWAGFTAAKIVMDSTITQYPILRFVEPENIRLKVRHGRIQEYRFIIDKVEKRNNKYFLHEVYGWREDIGAFIDYECICMNVKGDESVVSLEEMGLNESDFEIKIFPGINRPLAFYKPNLTPNNEVEGTIFGSSDYSGIQSEFDGLDEAVSLWFDDIRNGRTIFGVPESMVMKNLMGKNQAYDRFLANTVITKSSTAAQKGEEVDKIEKLNPEVNIDKYLSSIDKATSIILRETGISPITIGINNGEMGANASAEARKDAERQTIKTRNMKVLLWTPFIEDIYNTMLQVNDWANSKKIGQYDLSITFNPYIDSTIEERLSTSGLAVGNVVMSIEKAVDYSWRDELTEEEKEEEVQRIKTQNGEIEQELMENQDSEVGVDDGKESVEELLLNGAQITSAVNIVEEFNQNLLTFEAAQEMLETFLNIPKDKAKVMLGDGKSNTAAEASSEEEIPNNPLLTPNTGESEDEFIKRFMSNDKMENEFPDEKQRLTIARKQYKEETS